MSLFIITIQTILPWIDVCHVYIHVKLVPQKFNVSPASTDTFYKRIDVWFVLDIISSAKKPLQGLWSAFKKASKGNSYWTKTILWYAPKNVEIRIQKYMNAIMKKVSHWTVAMIRATQCRTSLVNATNSITHSVSTMRLCLLSSCSLRENLPTTLSLWL